MDESTECYNWQQYNDTMLLLYCDFPDETSYFISVSVSADRSSGKVVGTPQPIAADYSAEYCLTMKVAGRRLFVLDNDIEGEG